MNELHIRRSMVRDHVENFKKSRAGGPKAYVDVEYNDCINKTPFIS